MKSKQAFFEALTAGSTVGGITAGTNLEDMNLYEVFDMLLNPYQPPAFTSFSISGQATTLEIGDSIDAGSKTFTWGTSNSANVQTNSINISDTSGALLSSEANDGSATYTLDSNITNTTVGSTKTFNISATNTNSSTFSSSFTVTWKAYFYTGKSTLTILTDDDAVALSTSSLGGVPNETKSYSAGPGYIYYVYPSSFANINTMKDVATNLDVPYIQLANITISNSFSVGTTYKVFRTLNQLNGAITLITT
jgi:hypothetical protein